MRLRLKMATASLAATMLAGGLLAAPAFADSENGARAADANAGAVEDSGAEVEERAPRPPQELNAQARKYANLLELASAQTGVSTADLVSQLRGETLAAALGRAASAALVEQVLADKRAQLESQGLRPARIERELKKLETETRRLLARRVPPAVLRQLTRWANGSATRPVDPTPSPPAVTPGPGPIYGGGLLLLPSLGADSVTETTDAKPAATPDATRPSAGSRPIYGNVQPR